MATPMLDNRQLGTDTARLNLLTNGGFEINQRNGPATQIGGGPIYRLDRWYLQTTAGALLGVTQISSTIGTPGFSANLTYTHAAGGVGLQSQQIEAPAQFGGKTVSLSVMAKASVVGYARLQIAWNGGATYGAYNTTTAGERLTATATLPTGLTTLIVSLVIDVGSCTVEVNDATLVVGSVAADYAPLHPADDLARCLRYYETIQGTNTGFLLPAQAYSTTGIQSVWPYKAMKASTPTLTSTPAATWGACIATGAATGAATSATIGATNVYTGSFFIGVSGGLVAGNASMLLAAAGATAILMAESNP